MRKNPVGETIATTFKSSSIASKYDSDTEIEMKIVLKPTDDDARSLSFGADF